MALGALGAWARVHCSIDMLGGSPLWLSFANCKVISIVLFVLCLGVLHLLMSALTCMCVCVGVGACKRVFAHRNQRLKYIAYKCLFYDMDSH